MYASIYCEVEVISIYYDGVDRGRQQVVVESQQRLTTTNELTLRLTHF